MSLALLLARCPSPWEQARATHTWHQTSFKKKLFVAEAACAHGNIFQQLLVVQTHSETVPGALHEEMKIADS